MNNLELLARYTISNIHQTVSYCLSLSAADLQKGAIKLTKKSLVIGLIAWTIIISTGAYILFFQPKQAEAAWYDEKWAYRQTVALTNSGSNQTDYQISFTLDTATLITASKLQSDCDDIRITDINGKLLPHWIQTSVNPCNNASTKIWAKVPSITTSGATVYVYYGNPSATNVEDGNKVFTFFDDFSGSTINAQKWPDQTGTWTISGGTLYSTTADSAIHQANLSGSIIMETSVKGATTGTQARFGLADANYTSYLSGAGNDGVFWHMWASPAGSLYEDSKVSGSGTQYQVGSYSANTYNVYKIIFSSGSNAKFYQDATLHQEIATGVPSVDLGVWLSNDATVQTTYDWVFTRKYAATEPSAAAPTNEEQGKGPIAYFAFDEGTGTSTKDTSNTRLTGTLASSASWQTEDKCVSGKCLYFNGSAAGISIPNAPVLTPSDNWSVSFWSKIDPSQTSWQGVISLTNGAGWGIYAAHSSKPFLYTHSLYTGAGAVDNSQWYFYGNTQSYTSDWKYFTLTRTGSTYRWYVNGKLDTTQTKTEDVDQNTSTTWTIAFNYSSIYKGFIDELKVYKYARTADQVKSDYQSGLSNAGTNQGTSAVLGSSPEKWMSDGLVGYWKMDEAAANSCTGGVNDSCDSSGNGKDGAWNGTNIAATTGKFGNGVVFNGTDDYISMGDQELVSTALSFSFWIKPTSIATSDKTVLSKYATAGNNRSYLIRKSAAEIFVALSSDGTSSAGKLTELSTASSKLTTGWNFVTVTYDGTTIRTYINANQEASTTHSGGVYTSGTANLLLGNDSTNYLDGSLDDVRIYNRALSSKEVSDLYNWAPGPVGYYTFDEGSGNPNDYSGNGYNGTISGNPTWVPGKYGKGLKFDGSGDIVTVANFPASASTVGETGTVSFWLKTTGAQNSKGLVDFNGTAPLIYLNGSGDYQIYNGTADDYGCSTTRTLNTFQHVTYAWNNNTVKLYIDGVLKCTDTSWETTFSRAAGNLIFGTYYTTNYLTGILDDLRIYNYERTQKQIVSDMNAGHPAGGSPVGSAVGHWDFDEGYGTTAGDQGPNANHGTISGATWTNAGKFGKALYFGGTDTRVYRTTSASLLPSGGLTIAAWINIGASSSNYTITIRGNTADVVPWAHFYYDGSNNKLVLWNFNGNAAASSNAISIEDNAWHYVAVGATAGGTVRFYLDGKDITPSSGNSTYSDTTYTLTSYPFEIGARTHTSGVIQELVGYIDEVKLYNYELTADEVKLDYNRSSSMVLGSLSDNSSYQSNAANQEYCIPGDSGTCSAPVAAWSFEERTGTSANDTSGNGLTGTLGGDGSGTDLPTWTNGKVGASLSFDGSDDHVLASDNDNLSFTNKIMTINAWIKPSVVTGDNGIVAKRAASNFEYGFYVSDSKLSLNLWTAASASVCSTAGSATLSTNTWYFVTAVADGTNCYLYLNGVRDGTAGAISGTVTNGTAGVYIGYDNSGVARYFNGKIDQVRIFNYARTAAQIAWDYNRGGPVGYWDLDECQGTTAYDQSGNSNNGTLTATSTVGTCTTASTFWGGTAGTGAGKRNYAPTFNGTGDYFTLSDSSALKPTTALTVSAWIKPTNFTCTGADTNCQIFSKYGGNYKGYKLFTASSGIINFQICTPSACPGTTSASAPATGSWSHIVGVWDGANMQIYINGNKSGNPVAATTITQDTTVPIIGKASWYGGDYFNGQIDDVKIFNYALTPVQVKEIYQGGAVNFGPSSGAP